MTQHRKTLQEYAQERLRPHSGTVDDLIKLSTHHNGHKRENAVRRLGTIGDAFALPSLLTRVNDWVPQVRSAAKHAINALLTTENANFFAMYLPELKHLSLCDRATHTHLINTVEQFLVQDQNTHALITGLTDSNRFVSRACATLVVKNSPVDISQKAKANS